MAMILMILVTIGFTVLAALMAARGRVTAAALPTVAARVLAFGPGVFLAFAGALHAQRQDADYGIGALVVARGHSLRAFALRRVVALAAWLGGFCAAGALLVAVGGAVTARGFMLALAALHSGLAGAIAALAFGCVLAPVALATLGARSRVGGYLAFVAILSLPELARLLMRDLPREWSELFSIPSAVTVLAQSLSPGHVAIGRALAALAVLSVVAVIATAACVAEAHAAMRASAERRGAAT